MFLIARNDLQSLFTAVASKGYTLVGPTIRDGAVVLDRIDRVEDLPQNVRDNQAAGSYGLTARDDGALFGYVVGPHAWKRFLFPPRARLFSARKSGKGFELDPHGADAPVRYAFLGVRPCELAAIGLQDAVFLHGGYVDAQYAATRKQAFLISVNCTEPGGTCFCSSMNTGPRAHNGFDLALTEIITPDRHDFLVEIGSQEGDAVLTDVPHREASRADIELMEKRTAAAGRAMGRSLDTHGLRQILNESFEHAHWDDIAKRCLGCANCTLVCPTCFCNTVEDVTDLAGDHAERVRRWDSCFTSDFTRIAGGNIRMTTRTRYRQWLTHKFANWHDQFGTAGCVGCGRCITWCPAGIDLTAELAAFRETSTTTITG